MVCTSAPISAKRLALSALSGLTLRTHTPEEIFRRPADRRVAAFVGDVNVLGARLDRIDAAAARVSLGATSLAVPREPLQLAEPGDLVDVFVRPEQLYFAAPGAAAAVEGTVTAQVFMGGHVDFHVSVAAAMGGRLLVRLPDGDARVRWPIGARVGIAVAGEQAIAFLRSQGP